MELNFTIDQLVAHYLPPAFSVSQAFIEQELKLQQFLHYKDAGVSEKNAYNWDSYSGEWQLIFAYLIIWVVYQKILAGAFITVSGSTSDTSTGKGPVKKITTGPTDVEFHNSTESLAELIKALQSPDGWLAWIMGYACPLGTSVGIKLPFCPGHKIPGSILVVGSGCGCASSNAIFTIICHELYKPASMG